MKALKKWSGIGGLVFLLVLSCAKDIEVKNQKPSPGEEVIITVRKDLKSPLLEAVIYKKNMDWKYEVITPRLEKGVYIFAIKTDTLASLIQYRVVDENNVVLPEDGEGIIIFYTENKPVKNAFYYRGLIEEKLIPYAQQLDEKEREKRSKRALNYYEKELEYYPDNVEVLARIYGVKFYLIPEDQRQEFIQRIRTEVDSIFNARKDLSACKLAYGVAQVFGFPEADKYYRELKSYPPDPRTLDIFYRETLSRVRMMPPEAAIATLENFLENYGELYSKLDKAPQFLSTVYNWIYYISIWSGDTLKALNALDKLIKINPYDPTPFIVKASLLLETQPPDLEGVGKLLEIASGKFGRESIYRIYPFYDLESRDEYSKRIRSSYLRVVGRYSELTGDLERAITAYREVIELQGGNLYADPGDHEMLAGWLAEMGHYKEAGEHYVYALITGAEKESVIEGIKEMLIKEGVPEEKLQEKIDSILALEDKLVEEAPDFKVETIDGKTISLSDYRGKVVVLNFWATWCRPCRNEIPLLNGLVDKFAGNNDVVFIALTNDSKDRVEDFLKNQNFKYLQTFASSEVYEKYKVTAIPTHYIINKEGKVIVRIVGSPSGIDKILEEKIKRLLQL